PEAAFLASAARRLGLTPRLLATDFCTTRDGFLAAVREARPAGVVFFDAVEWREIVTLLAGFALEAGAPRVIVAGASLADPATRPEPQAAGVLAAPDLPSFARALGADGPAPAIAELPLDLDVFGGPALLDRALGASLFGDLGSVPLVAVRAPRSASSPCAASARFEGALADGRREALPPAVAHAPLERVGAAAKAVEWWDRDAFDLTLLHPAWAKGGAADRAYFEPVRERGLRQTVRLNARTPVPMLETLAGFGVDRVVFDCDALEDRERVPGATASAAEVARAAGEARSVGLETGVLFCVGLPDETPDDTARRCDALRAADLDRLRVIPFEPTGGAAAEWCRRRGAWPPEGARWNRELHHPLRQPHLGRDAFVRSFETALLLAAEIQTRDAGAPR
ncbi:MAG TPA: hypothetical protein VEI02_01710, partial [Planctomycetota bacterium]|nr:hypothetical protein [Planctomycetota bacterium]